MSPWTVLLWAVVATIAATLATVVAMTLVVAYTTVRDTLADRRREQAAVAAFRAQLERELGWGE